MRVIPVLDIRKGMAVRADGGDRSSYGPLGSVLARGSDPRALAGAFREELGLEELYLADLDAISEAGAVGRPEWDARPELGRVAALVQELVCEGSHPWVDAGVSGRSGVAALLRAGALRVVIGLETLPGLEALEGLAGEFGAERLAFSLDLRGERPVTRVPSLVALAAEEIATQAARSGLTTLIALDLDRVGRWVGFQTEFLERVARSAPGVMWVAGGGARDAADLMTLARAGYTACLVGTAVHEGRIGRAEVRALAREAGRL